jgi:hypothetical protein
MRRRDFLAGTLGASGALGATAAARTRPALACAVPAATPVDVPAVYLIPGYRPHLAHYCGRPVLEAAELRGNIPAGYDGNITMVVRVDESDGSVRHALMPIAGHAITAAAPGRAAFWNSMEGPTMLLFDPATLEMTALLTIEGGFVGGGHGRFTSDGKHLVVTERRPRERYTGSPADHHGRICIRDAETLRLVERYDCGGMQPHDLALLPDGSHAVVANYGSFLPKDSWKPQIIEPCLTVLDLADGKVVEKRVNTDLTAEVRHLAAGGPDRVAAILARRGSLEELELLMSVMVRVYLPDRSADDGGTYLPAPVQRYDLTSPDGGSTLTEPEDPLRARQGQSIVYDPVHDEFIATFASSSTVIAFAGDTGAVRQVIETEPLGVRQPRGLILHPDGRHYAVAGAWDNLLLFERGTHAAAPGRMIFVTLFEHSHIAALPA